MKSLFIVLSFVFSMAANANPVLNTLQNSLWRAGSVVDGYFWEFKFDTVNDGTIEVHGFRSLYGEGNLRTYTAVLSGDNRDSVILKEIYTGDVLGRFYIDKNTGRLCSLIPYEESVCMKKTSNIAQFPSL